MSSALRTLQDAVDRLAEPTPGESGDVLPRGLRFCYGRENNTHQGVTLSWPTVAERFGGLGVRLIAAGVGGGDVVMLHCHDQQIALLAFLACIHIGAVPVAVSPLGAASAERLVQQFHRIVAAAKPTVVIVDKPLANEHLDGHAPLPTVLAIEDIPAAAICPRLKRARPDDVCFLQFTSGSTSSPKGVVVTHRMLLDNLASIVEVTGWGSMSGMVGWLPIYHDMSLVGLYLMSVYQRGRGCFFPTARFGRNPDLWMQLMSEERAGFTAGPNFSLAMINRHAERRPPAGIDLSNVRGIICGSEPISAAVVRRFQQIHAAVGLVDCVMPAFGMAECTLMATSCPPRQALVSMRVDRVSLEQQRLASPEIAGQEAIELVGCGAPASGMQVSISARDGSLLGDGKVGEVLLRGGSLLSRYYRDDAATAAAFTTIDKQRWFRTGDLGFMHSGHLYICGRAKDMIIHNGVNYFPADIEQALVERLNFVRLAAVVDLRRELADEFLGLGILFEDSGRGGDSAQAEGLVCDLVKEYTGLPVAVCLGLRAEHVPRTTSGKLVRPEIRSRLRDEWARRRG